MFSDPDSYSKLRKHSGMAHEDVIKTMQLKKEIEHIIETKMNQESGSSEDSSEHNQNDG